MEMVLADTLLSQGLEAGALLRAVCGEDGTLSADRAETLRFLLQRVAAAELGGWRGQDAEGEEAAAQRLAREAALGYCLPALLRAGGAPAAKPPEPEQLRLVRASCRALRSCAALGGPPLAERLAQEALASLEASTGAARLWVEAAVELLAAVAPWLEEPALLRRTVGVALRLLRGDAGDDEESRALLVAGRLLPVLGKNHAALGHVWEGLMLTPESATTRVSRTLLVLSALSDAVLPAGAQLQDVGSDGETASLVDARLHSSFWRVVQKGLTESDAPCRKRARYLLKRAVDVSAKLHAECRCTADAGNGTYLSPCTGCHPYLAFTMTLTT